MGFYRAHLVFALTALAPCQAHAASWELLGSRYQDAAYQQNTVATTVAQRMAVTPGLAFSLRLGGTAGEIEDKAALEEKDRHVDVKQGSADALFEVGNWTLGLSTSQMRSDATRVDGVSANVGRWFNEQTLQLTLTLGKAWTKQGQIIKYDAQADALFLPRAIGGESATLAATYLATPTTILLGSYTRTDRTDRPLAEQAQVEWREAFPSLGSSWHNRLMVFRNVGSLKRTTDYGKTGAYAGRTDWYWTLPTAERHGIIGIGSRYYQEEQAESAFLRSGKLTTVFHQASFRYRMGDGLWTDARDEWQIFAGSYATSEPRRGMLWGAATSFTFN